MRRLYTNGLVKTKEQDRGAGVLDGCWEPLTLGTLPDGLISVDRQVGRASWPRQLGSGRTTECCGAGDKAGRRLNALYPSTGIVLLHILLTSVGEPQAVKR